MISHLFAQSAPEPSNIGKTFKSASLHPSLPPQFDVFTQAGTNYVGATVSYTGCKFYVSTDSGVTWIEQASNNITSSILGTQPYRSRLMYANGIYVFNTYWATVTSTDLITWSVTSNLGTVFVASPNAFTRFGDASIEVSTDAVTWTKKITNMPANILSSMTCTFINNRFIYMGTDGTSSTTFYVSTDATGSSWNTYVLNVSTPYAEVAHFDGTEYIVVSTGISVCWRIPTSFASYTQVTFPSSSYSYRVVVGGNLYYYTGYSTVANDIKWNSSTKVFDTLSFSSNFKHLAMQGDYSKYGIIYSLPSSKVINSGRIFTLNDATGYSEDANTLVSGRFFAGEYNGTIYAIVGITSTYKLIVYFTSDFTTWNKVIVTDLASLGVTFLISYCMPCIRYSNGKWFVSSGKNPSPYMLGYTSTDLVTWTASSSLSTFTASAAPFAYPFLMGGVLHTPLSSSNTIKSTDGGVTWVAGATLPITASSTASANGVAFFGNGTNNYKSTDGSTFTPITTPSNLSLTFVVFSSTFNKYYALDTSGRVSYSSDSGLTWTLAGIYGSTIIPLPDRIIVIYGYDSSISMNGTTWATYSSVKSFSIYSKQPPIAVFTGTKLLVLNSGVQYDYSDY